MTDGVPRTFQDHLIVIVNDYHQSFAKSVADWEDHEDLPEVGPYHVMGISHASTAWDEGNSTVRHSLVIWVRTYDDERDQ